MRTILLYLTTFLIAAMIMPLILHHLQTPIPPEMM